LAKGPLAFHHFLIIPKKHIGSTLSLDNDTLLEIEQKIEYLIEFLQRCNEDFVLYERYINLPHQSADHMHIQIIGIPQKNSFDLLDQFDKICHKRKIEFKEEKFTKLSDLRKVMEGINMKYFYMEFYGLKSMAGKSKHHFIHFIKDDENFPINFGREFVCNVLGEDDKANWKNCLYEKEEEISNIKKLKDEIRGTF
jgi:diadenosine tetraphosphate (Ap4A) HIT family hydrolase